MLLDDIFANVPESYTQADKELIEKAYYFAEKAHEGQKRASGEPYFTHCVAVALILCEMKVQSIVVAAALLAHLAERDRGGVHHIFLFLLGGCGAELTV